MTSEAIIVLDVGMQDSLPENIPEEIDQILKNTFKSFFLVVESENVDGGSDVGVTVCVRTDNAKTVFSMMGAANKTFSHVLKQMGGYDIQEMKKQ